MDTFNKVLYSLFGKKSLLIMLLVLFSNALYAGKNYTNYENDYKIKSHSQTRHKEVYKVKKFEFTKKSKTSPSIELNYKAYFFETLHVEDIFPKKMLSQSTKKKFKNLRFKNVLFISLQSPDKVHNNHTYGQTYISTITKDDIPNDILHAIEWEDIKTTATIEADGTTYGGNFKGYFDDTNNDDFLKLFKTLGIKVEPFVINGSSSKYDPFLVVSSGKVQKMRLGELVKEKDEESNKKYFKSIGFNMSIPQMKIPKLDKFVTLKDIAFGVNSSLYALEPWKDLPKAFKEKNSGADLDVYITAQSAIKIGKYTHKGAFLLDLQQDDKQDSFTMLSFNKDEDIFANFKLKDFKYLKNSNISTIGAYKITISQTKTETSKSSTSLSAVVQASINKKELDMTAKFEIDDKGIFFDFVDIHDNLTLADFTPSIPKANEFALSEIKIYPPFNPNVEPGIEAKTKFFDIENDLFLFEYKQNDILAIDVSAKGDVKFDLGKLLNKVKKGTIPANVTNNLSTFGVANGAIIFSNEPIKIDFSGLKNGIAKDLFTTIFGKRKIPLDLNKVTFISDFQIKEAGTIGTLLKKGEKGVKIGLSDDTYILGSVQGIFGKDPFNLLLELKQDEEFDISKLNLKLPPMFKHIKPSSTSIQEGIFIKVIDGSAEVALSTGFGLSIKKTDISFDGSFGVNLEEDDIRLSITGETKDTIDNFVGIPHYQVNGVTVNALIGDDFTYALELDTSMMGRTMQTSGDLTFDAKGYPKGIGFKTNVSKLDEEGWKLVNYSAILGVPTFASAGLSAITGAGVMGIIGAIAGNPEGDVAGGVAGAPFAGVGAAPGAVIGGIVSSGIVGGLGVAIGGAAGGVAGAATGLATGAIGDAIVGNTKLGVAGMNTLTKLQSNILKADEVYVSFATANAADADVSIPEGIHFNMTNVTWFDKFSSTHRPDFTGIYALANNITKDIDKTEKFIVKMEKDFVEAEKRFAKELKDKEAEYKKKFKKNWKKELHKDILKTFKFTEKEVGVAKKYAKILSKIYNKVMLVIHYELGLIKEKPKEVKYVLTNELKKSIQDLKKIMNGVKIQNENFGPIKIPDAQIQLVPTLVISGDIKLFDTFDESIDIQFNDKNQLAFNSTFDVKKFGSMKSEFILQNSNQVEILGQFSSTNKLESWLEDKMKSDATKLLSDSNNIYNTIADDISKLNADIGDIEQDITSEMNKAATYVENSKIVQDAKMAWHKASSDYNRAISQCKNYKSCLWHGHGCVHPCNDAYELAKGSVDIIASVLNKYASKLHISHITNPSHKKQAYKDAKKNVDISTYNAKVAQYKSDKADKMSDLADKQNQLKKAGGKQFSGLSKRLSTIIEAANIADNFLIHKVEYVATLNDKKSTDTIFLMRIDYTLFNKDQTDFVLFKPFDITFNEASFGIFSIKTFEHILDNIKDKTLEKVIKWTLNNVNEQVSKLQGFMEKNISPSDEARYKKAIESFINSTQSIRATAKEYDLTDYSSVSAVDLMSNSKSFENHYIAVAHSTLCLGVAPNGIDVFQENCKDIKAERWSAAKILNADKSPTGYVKLVSNGLCLKAATNNNKDSGLPLKLSQCNTKDMHEQWKIISKDGIFDMIVNRYSQKCLHFDTVNTNPRTAYAVWSSCLDIDSQGFRDIKDAERPTWYNVSKMIKAKSGSCLSTKKSFDDYFLKTQKGHFTATKDIFKRMKQRKDDILISTQCTKGIENEFNYLELINGDIKLVHAQTGWCVAPKAKNSKELSLKPCNKGTYMFWDPIEVGDAIILKNKEANKCITLSALKDGKSISNARLENCSKSATQTIDFLK